MSLPELVEDNPKLSLAWLEGGWTWSGHFTPQLALQDGASWLLMLEPNRKIVCVWKVWEGGWGKKCESVMLNILKKLLGLL